MFHILFALYIFSLFLLLKPIVEVILKEINHDDFYYLVGTNIIFTISLLLFYVWLQNLYFAFFSAFFLVIFSFQILLYIKKEMGKMYLWSIPYVFFQIFLFCLIFYFFLQSF